MSAEIQAAKAEMRREIKERQRQTTEAEQRENSRLICERLTKSDVWREAKSLLLYAPMPGEPDVTPLLAAALAAGKALTLPRYHPLQQTYAPARIENLTADLVAGKFSIPEPAGHCAAFPLMHLDLALVPGVCFDSTGRRLGRGKGYYDRLLAPFTGIKCGLAFDWQIVTAVPAEPHDVHLNWIITPTRWHRT